MLSLLKVFEIYNYKLALMVEKYDAQKIICLSISARECTNLLQN